MHTPHSAYRLLSAILLLCLYTGCNSANQEKKAATNSSSTTDTTIRNITFKELPIAKEEANRINLFAQKWWDATITSSVFNGGVLVAKNGNIVFEKYKGPVFPGSADSMSASTPIHIASVTKTFTAMAILKLWEQKKLNIEDSVSKYLQGFNYPGVTIRSLLTHRSGLPNYIYFSEKFGLDPLKFITNNDVLNFLINRKAEIKDIGVPNKSFSYNNTNYLLLALIIEAVSSKPFPQFMKESIFEPFGMKNTFVYTTQDSAGIPPSYDWRARPIALNYLDGTYGDKNIYSTVRDLLKWDRALTHFAYLRKETLELAYQPTSNEKPGVKNYGLGWRMNIFDNGKKMIFHTGWWHGNNSIFIRLVDKDATIIALNNRFTRNTYGAKWLANAFDEYFTVPPPEDPSVDSLLKELLDSSSKKPVQKRKKEIHADEEAE